ncbi:LOW QUALITY PROTEIN: Halomucin [Frankliniella fusca]|uniref:Halomucin n=1 Tax=Frankliniella fusca TaxID=407009 RepID=A0AAE1I038_9NEOP|nr:LOW QUALITY PROTEIN: Halomucin [Frankliniella fusca]
MDASSEDEHNSVRSSSPYRSPVSSPGIASSPPDPASSPPYVPNSSPSRDANHSPPAQQYLSRRKDYEIFEPGVPSLSKRLRREECSDSNDSVGNGHESNWNREFGHDADTFHDGSDRASQVAAGSSVFIEADQENDNAEENRMTGAEDIVFTESSSEDSSSCGSSSAGSDFQSSSSEDENESSAGSDNTSDSEQYSDSDSDGDVVSPPVYEGSSLTVDEAQYGKTALGNTLKSTLKFLPTLNIVPKSLYSLLKYVSNLCPLGRETVHFYCSVCQYYLGDTETCCTLCTGSSKKFYQVPLADQIKNLFENHGLAAGIDKYAAERQAAGINDGLYSDLCDGSVIKNVKTPDGYNLTLVGHTDGLSISKSSNVSVWPLEFVIAELPPHLRYKYVFVCGIWIDERKTNLNSYLRPFVTEISLLNESGGVKWVHPKTKLQHSTTVTVPIFIADAPARAQLQNILSHGGKHCCNVCEQKMQKVPAEPLRLGVKRKSGESSLLKREREVLRTAERMTAQGKLSRKSQRLNGGPLKAIKGVRGSSVLASLPGCDRSTVVFPEYMHVLLCLIKHLLTIILTKSGPWNLSDKQDEINAFLENIRVPVFITRIPRSNEYYSKWKANERRSFLLYYSVIILSQCMKEEYFQHWILLVMAIYLFLKDTVSDVDIDRATIMLQIFYRDFSQIYIADFFYLSCAQHPSPASCCSKICPLWCHSAFQFESYNGALVKFIHRSHHQAQELVNNIRLAFGVAALEGRVKKNSTSKSKTIELKNRVNSCRFTNAEEALFTLEFGESACKIKVFYRAKVGNEVYTSIIYKRQKKRNNYTICYFNRTSQKEKYGEIKYICEARTSSVALVYQFDLDHLRCFTHTDSGLVMKHVIPTIPTDKIHIIHLNEIRHKVIRICDYLCLRPNKYEVNL